MERIRPRLVVLDPLVRLHGVDENAVADIAPLLGFLRDLQRRFDTAILLVHHSRKSGATRSGQALRGSSELHAWGDSNLYLRRRDTQIVMTVEHRAAAGLSDIESELADDGEGPAVRLRRQVPDKAPPAPKTPNSGSSRCSRTPLSRSPSPRSGNAPQPATQPSPRRCTSSCARDVSSAGREVATATLAACPVTPPCSPPAPTAARISHQLSSRGRQDAAVTRRTDRKTLKA